MPIACLRRNSKAALNRCAVVIAMVLAGYTTGAVSKNKNIVVATAIDKTPTDLIARSSIDKMQFELRGKSKRKKIIILPMEKDVSLKGNPHNVRVLANSSSLQMLIFDQYGSKVQGMSRCQAGEELFIRLLNFAATPPKQIWQMKIASCLDNLELSDAGGQWSAGDQILTVNWLTGPSGGPETRHFKVTDNQVTLIP
jgi:hypothetical protein